MMTSETTVVLWLAAEDCAGLWEVVWELRSRHGELEESELLTRGRESLRALMDSGLVTMYRCHEPYGEMSPLDNAVARSVLDTDSSWAEPEPDGISL